MQEISLANSSYYDGYNFKPYNPDSLYQNKGSYDVFDDMRKDDQIKPLSLYKKYIILNSNIDIVSKSDDVKKFFKEVLFKECDRNFKSYFMEMLTCFDYGNSFSEPVFKVKNFKQFGDKVYLKTIKTRAPHSIEYHQDDFGNLKFIRQLNAHGFNDFDPNKFILLSNQREFDNYYGKSDYDEGVYTAWWSKKIVIKFLNIFLERFGAPTILASYKSGATSAELRTQIKKMIKNVSSRSGFMFPDNIEISLLESGSKGTNPFIDTINLYNMMIARALLFPDLLGMGGSETSGGSYSLGQEQFDIWYLSLELPKQLFLKEINRKIIKPLVTWNFGEEAAQTTELTMQRTSQKEKQENTGIYLEALKTGKIKPMLDHVNTFLSSIDYPEIEADVWEKQEEERKSIIQGIQQPKEVKEKDPAIDKKPDDKEDKEKDKKKEDFTFQPHRELTIYEKSVNFTRIDRSFNELNEKYHTLLSESFEAGIDNIITYIERKKIIENKRMDLVSGLVYPGTTSIKVLFTKMLVESSKDGIKEAKSEIKIQNFKLTQKQDVADVAEWIKTNAIFLADTEAAEILKKITPILMDSINEGMGVKEAMRMIDEALKGYDITLGAPRVENIVRTNVSKAWNQSRLDEFTKVDNEIQAFQFSSIMDSRTSDVCASLDGRVFRKSESAYYNPPLHFMCRSLLIPIFNEEKFDGYDKLPGTKKQGGGFLELT